MNKLELHSDMLPHMAIIVYKTSQSYYLERRKIKEDGKMGAGVPLTQKCLTGLVSALSPSDKNIIHGAIPNCMLYSDSRAGKSIYVWYRKEEKKYLLFDKKLQIPNGEMYIPGLVFQVSGQQLSVYAYKGRLTESSKLYRAPFFNVSVEYVCLGNASFEYPDERTYSNIIQYWENMFWKSEFSHILGSNPVVGNLKAVTLECIQNGQKFPKEQLIPLDFTLKDLLP